jgi:DNA topoisomerase-3
LLYARKIAQGKGLVIPEEAQASSAAMSAWIDSNRSAKRRRGRKSAYKPAQAAAPMKNARERKAGATAATSRSAQPNALTGTPLRIPYGNKEVALKLGARYGSAGWYAPPGVDLTAFGNRDGYNPHAYSGETSTGNIDPGSPGWDCRARHLPQQ